MHAAKGAFLPGPGVIDLNNVFVVPNFLQLLPAKDPRKEATVIFVGLRFYDIGA